MKKIVAAFKCMNVEDHDDSYSQRVQLRGVHGGDGDQDWSDFTVTTPYAELEMDIDEGAPAHGDFEAGEIYYATFTHEDDGPT